MKSLMLDHPLRGVINSELHSRPPMDVSTPALVHHAVLLAGPNGKLHDLITPLCQQFNIVLPGPDERHIIRDVKDGTLKWERHGEFETLTHVFPTSEDGPLDEDSRAKKVESWTAIEDLLSKYRPASQLNAVQIQILMRGRTRLTSPPKHKPSAMIGAQVNGGAATLWSDFAIAPSGYTEIILEVEEMRAKRCGRLVQRILEIETYRYMALMGFPVARKAQADLRMHNAELNSIITDLDLALGTDASQSLLDRIQDLSHRTNKMFGDTEFRFAATKAYYAIVESRLEELREERIVSYSRPSTFLKRRMQPAIDHSSAIGRQRETLERRLTETSQLLRTKVETGLADQNRQLLEQIKTSTQSQVRLQKAVEGFSVVAISYYLVSLLAIFLKGGEKAGLFKGWEIYEAALAPIAIILVVLLIRRVRP